MGTGDLHPSAIDTYLTDLSTALRGPRRVKAGLLEEARDGLLEAAEADQAAGAERPVAERRAVAEFGRVPDVVPDYQRVLGFAQARRTAVLVFLVTALQSIGSTFAWRTAGLGWTSDPGPFYYLASSVVDWTGVGLKVLTLLVLLMCGIGVRFLGAKRWIPRVTGYYAAGVCVYSVLVAALLASGYSAEVLFTAPRLGWLLAVGFVPFLFLGWSARRCLVSA